MSTIEDEKSAAKLHYITRAQQSLRWATIGMDRKRGGAAVASWVPILSRPTVKKFIFEKC